MNHGPQPSRVACAEQKEQELCSVPATGERHRLDGSKGAVTWQLPEEAPVAVQINSEPYAVMMATPADLRNFATGFLLGEGLLRSPKDIAGILVMPVENGVTVDVAVAEGAIDLERMVRRKIEGRAGCGLCGVEDIAAAVRPLTPLARTWHPEPAAVIAAAAQLPKHQPMNAFNRTVHAAAWATPRGDIVLVREDIGRHNALDKLIGALATEGIEPQSGFVLMTSRCSYELVQKAVTAGISALITISAPTAMAYRLAKSNNLYLASLGDGGLIVFNP